MDGLKPDENHPQVTFLEFKRSPMFFPTMDIAIVKGTGYHVLEATSDMKPVTHATQLPFPAPSMKTESEGEFLV
jgi:hypothetical protein